MHLSSFCCHKATSPWPRRTTGGRKQLLRPPIGCVSHIHRGVALADPDYLSGSEAGSGCLSLSWSRCVSRYSGASARPLPLVPSVKPCDELTSYRTFDTLEMVRSFRVAAPGWSELPLSCCVIEVQAILARCQGLSAQCLGKCSKGCQRLEPLPSEQESRQTEDKPGPKNTTFEEKSFLEFNGTSKSFEFAGIGLPVDLKSSSSQYPICRNDEGNERLALSICYIILFQLETLVRTSNV